MAVEDISRLRTIAIVGQGGAGKTQLAEAMLYTAGATKVLGRPDDGSAVMDFEPEELARHISISSSFHHLNWKKTEAIVANTPGYSAFLPECFNTMRAVDGVVFVASAGGDLKVEAEKIFDEIKRLDLPRIAFVSRLERERMNFAAALNDLEKTLDAKPVVLTLPIGEEAGFNGVIDVLAMKALTYADANGKAREEELSGDLRARAEEARTNLCEAVAETDDAMLEKYLEQGEISDDELCAALRNAVLACKLTPVICGSGAKNIGMGPLLDAIATLMPAPNERPAMQGQGPSNGTPVERPHDPAAPFSALVFKTVIDPFAGKLSIMRVMSGRAVTDANVLNSTRGAKEHFGHLLRLEGKKQSPLQTALAGENYRRREAQGHHHGRYALRRKGRHHISPTRKTRAGYLLCNSPQNPLRRGEILARAAAPGRGGSRARNPSRPPNPRDYSLGHRPDAYRGDGRKAQAQV